MFTSLVLCPSNRLATSFEHPISFFLKVFNVLLKVLQVIFLSIPSFSKAPGYFLSFPLILIVFPFRIRLNDLLSYFLNVLVRNRYLLSTLRVFLSLKYSFNYNDDYNRYETEIEEKWDSQYIVFGIAHLERFVEYKIQSGHEIYKGYLSQYSLGSIKLNGDNLFEEQYTQGDIINVSAEADYLFYEILGNPFLIYYRESSTQEPFVIPGYSLIILGLISLSTILVGFRKFKK